MSVLGRTPTFVRTMNKNVEVQHSILNIISHFKAQGDRIHFTRQLLLTSKNGNNIKIPIVGIIYKNHRISHIKDTHRPNGTDKSNPNYLLPLLDGNNSRLRSF